MQRRAEYVLHYTVSDEAHIAEYERFLHNGVAVNKAFFQQSYPAVFHVYIHPDRGSFDAALQQELHRPQFHSECWLVAIGEPSVIHLLTPTRWADGSCDGRYTTYADKVKTQKLITHELTHVFHGQSIRNHRFKNEADLGWFEEGLAVDVSGQLGSPEMQEVTTALQANRIPTTLHGLATWDNVLLRYSTMGSLVRYIDTTYGKAKLKELLQYQSTQEIVASLGVSESVFLERWQRSMLDR